MIKTLPAVAVLLLAASAVAGEGPLAFGGFAEAAATGQFAMREEGPRQTERPLVGAIRIAGHEVHLEQTTMAAVEQLTGD